MAKRGKRSTTRASSLFDDGGGGNGDSGAEAGLGDAGGNGQVISLHEATEARYLNYALSVITSRALPDVRDGLKPVQRRILYTMWQQGIKADAKHRKCAKVVGDVMGNYHPHGDSAIYEALVRMAQPFAMRMTLVDGSGNFGSLDGDGAAAMRYTECRLTIVAHELLQELGQQTVPFRPNYDGTKSEPVVLPARLPNLLINGSTGIAVGMATNIPPHNPEEVCKALLRLVDAWREDKDLSSAQLARTVKGPDFPTGGQILNSAEELRDIYVTGSGSVKVRATYKAGPTTRSGKTIVVTSVPYAVNKSTLVERIADVVVGRKMPLLVDVRDVSTDDVRIELILKKDADEQKVMAYLFKHTPLQTNFNVNLTCLLPTGNEAVGRPERCDLHQILGAFLQFRLEVVTRRLEHELAQLQKRIHILEGFALVFDALDEIIRIIRRSDGKADAAVKIMKRFPADDKGGGLDEEQTDAILELKLYRLAKLEILVIQEELADKKKRARAIGKLLKSEDARWGVVRDEIQEVSDTFAKPEKRRTVIQSAADEPEFTADDFIVAEDNMVVVTRDGWVKRQKEVKNIASTRLREGDSVLAVLAGSTRASCVFFSNLGSAYTCRFIDIPATTGYGEPIQKLFKLKDGERIVQAFSLDPRAIGDIKEDPKQPDYCPTVHGFAATSDGYALRFGLEAFVEPSTRSGRRFARPAKGRQVVGVEAIGGDEIIIAASHHCRATLCESSEVNYLSGPGKGVLLMKLAKDDHLLGFKASKGDRDLLVVETHRGAQKTISTAKYEVTGRGGKGREIQKNGKLVAIVPAEVEVPAIDGGESG